ncbi:MAG: hypothetical protein ABIP58_05335 [Dehalococcoidia bacterium]
MLRETDILYIPTNERQLRRIQRGGSDLDAQVRGWTQRVIEVLPAGLPTNADETYIFSLFLAQQRRRNLHIDAFQPDTSLMTTLRGYLPLPEHHATHEEIDAIHRVVSVHLDSDIERAGYAYCEDNNIPPESDPAIDWRVAIRFMSQSIYSRVCRVDPTKIKSHPKRFELALVARELASGVSEKRQQMFAAFAPTRA